MLPQNFWRTSVLRLILVSFSLKGYWCCPSQDPVQSNYLFQNNFISLLHNFFYFLCIFFCNLWVILRGTYGISLLPESFTNCTELLLSILWCQYSWKSNYALFTYWLVNNMLTLFHFHYLHNKFIIVA